MDIFLALLRTLVFVVATVVATVYVGRRIARGHALLWTGTTLLVTHWLMQFGWTTYAAGAPDAAPDPTGWLSWVVQLLPFLAAVALIWGIGQAAGAPSRRAGGGGRPTAAEASGGGGSRGAELAPAATTQHQPATRAPAAGAAGEHAGRAGGGPVVGPRVSPASQLSVAHTPTQSRPKPTKPTRPPGLIVPHAVPVVMTPSASRHSPLDPDPVVDLGPDDGPTGGTAVPPPAASTAWAPVPPPAQVPNGPAGGSSEASPGQNRPPER